MSLILMNESHFEEFFQVYSDTSLMKYVNTPLTRKLAHKKFNQALQVINSSQNPPKLTYMIYDANQMFIGLIGLTWGVRQRSASVGVMILADHQRLGFAHQAKKMMIESGFESFKLSFIYAHCDPRNVAANLANEKLGFNKLDRYVDEKKGTVIQLWVLSKNDWIR